MDPVEAPARAAAADTGWSVLRWSVVALAILSRLWWLDGRPPHFDEGVNGWFTDQMRHLGCYQYDPGNYHGPLHFYALFLFKSLLGRNLWALRLPTAIIGVLTVEWCFRFERFLGRRTSAWAAVAMLVSPATLYFQRDAIHEAWLLFFLVLGFWAVCGLCQEGETRHLWTAGLALAGMILTKETWLIHVGCLALAVPCVFLAELLRPSRRALLLPGDDEPPPLPPPDPLEGDAAAPARPHSWVTLPEPTLFAGRLRGAIAPQRWTWPQALAVAGTVVALLVFFYSGNFLLFKPANYSDKAHANSLTWCANIFNAYTPWGEKADKGEGHNKPFLYWCQLIVRNEPWTLLGLLAAAAYTVPALPGKWRSARRGALAAAALCAAALVAAHAWEHPFVETKGSAAAVPRVEEHASAADTVAEPTVVTAGKPAAPSTLRADHAVWWSLGGLIALAGMACVALPTPGGGTLRGYGAAAGAACAGTLFFPWVYPTPVLFSLAFVGLAAATAAMSLPAPGDWRVRLLAIYGIGTLWGYSIIHYKTPWCIISILWPFFFTGGALLSEWVEDLAGRGRETATCLGAAAAAVAAYFALDLNFLRPTDENFHQRPGENLGLVYVQSFDDVWTVTNPLLAEARGDRRFYEASGVILCDSTYPLPWLLGDFKNIGYYSNDRHPDDPDGYRAEFLLVAERRVDEVESRLDADYYKQTVKLRPALDELQLYLRASRFKHLMPAGREPEFHPVPTAPAAPSDLPDIGPTVPTTPAAGGRDEG